MRTTYINKRPLSHATGNGVEDGLIQALAREAEPCGGGDRADVATAPTRTLIPPSLRIAGLNPSAIPS
jgi:hypothetical protein